ncbi:PilW family protein [Steroidobacter flavus]|uniref:PilW family protein n=1 Tax=Steroidobacter flavus TaxID=1842136 RepID=A0ABV8SY98_9GAMM
MKVIVGNSRMRGFSLVELMVAITISSLLLVGVIALFISSRASYETTERLSRVQENGRFALDQLATDIRAAGFQGCARGTTPSRMRDYRISSVVNPASPDLRWNFAVPAQGFDGGEQFTPALNNSIFAPAPNPQGDVLVLRIPRREVRSLEVRTTQANAADPLVVYDIPSARLEVGEMATVSDCEARAFFQVTGYNSASGEIAHGQLDPAGGDEDEDVKTPGNSSNTFQHPFKKGASVLPVVTMIYYLAPTPDDTDDPTHMSLWRKMGGANRSDEIAQDIDRMEVRFGVDDGGAGGTVGDGRVDRYREAADIANWDQVLTVQIALLARAPEEYGTDRDNMTYTLFAADPADPDSEEVTAGPFNDRTQRKVFTATLALRNQIYD